METPHGLPAAGGGAAGPGLTETVEVTRELDDTGLQEMTPLFYQHGFEQLRMSLRDLLTVLGHNPDVTPLE